MQAEPEFHANRSPRLAVVIMALGVLLLLFSLRAAQQTPDGLDYAQAIKTGQDLLHPHHLLYNVVVRGLYLAVDLCGISASPILVAQVHNMFWAAVTVAALFFLMRAWLRSSLYGLLAAGSLLALRGFWVYSTQVEVYVPALGCLAVVAAVLATYRNDILSKDLKLVLGLLLALAIFYHQTNVLFCLPLVVYLVAARGRAGRSDAAFIVITAGLATLFAYAAVYVRMNAELSLSGFFDYALAYASYPLADWGSWANFSLAGALSLTAAQMWNIVAFPVWFKTAAAWICLVYLLLLIGWHWWHLLRGARARHGRLFCLIWLMTYLLFFWWWFPGDTDFFVATLLPILALTVMAWRDLIHGVDWLDRRTVLQWAIPALLMLLLVAVNLIATVLPLHRSRGPAYLEASLLAETAPDNACLYTSFGIQQHLRYYFDRRNVRNIDEILLHYYKGQTLPDSLLDGDCPQRMADLSAMSPRHQVSADNGFDRPDAWLEFLNRLCRCEYDRQGKLVASRRFTPVERLPFGPYILIDNRRAARDGLQELFAPWDDLLAGRQTDPVRPFGAWLAERAAPTAPTAAQ